MIQVESHFLQYTKFLSKVSVLFMKECKSNQDNETFLTVTPPFDISSSAYYFEPVTDLFL